jgi:DNA repair protein RecO (recombination protein O)
MSIIKAEGIILRSMKLGETSKILTLFTREHGVLKVVAKGSRSRKSRYGAILDLLNVIHLVYYHKDTRDLQIISAADIEETFPNLPADLEKWAYANACGELILRAHPAAEATPKLYPILLDCLRTMNETPGGRDRLCFWGLQMKLLGIFGVAPNFRRCLHCGTEAAATSRAHFHAGRGGFLCEKCDTGAGAMHVSREALANLAALQSLPSRKIVEQGFSSQSLREIEKLLQAYVRFHLEEVGRLQALEFIGELQF